MTLNFFSRHNKPGNKFISGLVLISFLWSTLVPPALAQEVFLPPPQVSIGLSTGYTPCQLRGIKIDPRDPFKLDFVVEEGDSGLKGDSLQEESKKLIKYFLATVTTPESDLWVNLSPYEDNRIIQDDFGRTAMGRDLLAQDYILKQITATLMHPDHALGKQFWAEVYKQAFNKFGTTDIPVDTFNKVWIVPQSADVYESDLEENDGRIGAFIDSARLKVLLESDYLASSMAGKTEGAGKENLPQAITASEGLAVQQIIREVIIPILEKEVNEGKNFALLRQIYHSLLLATWLKKKLKTAVVLDAPAEKSGMIRGNPLALLFLDKHKTGGLETVDPKHEIRSIYDRYVEAFKDGAYNIIREDYDIYSQELIPRKYFTGGLNFTMNNDNAMNVKKGTPASKIWTFRHGIFGIAIVLKVEHNSKRFNILSFHLIKNINGKTSNRNVFFKTIGALIVVAAVASFSLGLFTNLLPSDIISKSKPESDQSIERVEPAIEKPLPVQPPALTVETKSAVKDIYSNNSIQERFNASIKAREIYDNGVKNARDVNMTEKVRKLTLEETLDLLLILPGVDLDIRLSYIGHIYREAMLFAPRLLELGFTPEQLIQISINIDAKETSNNAKLRVRTKEGKVKTQGASQMERTTLLSVVPIARRLLEDKKEEGFNNFNLFYERVVEEIKKEKEKGTQNFWEDGHWQGLLIDYKTNTILKFMWLNHLIDTQPVPVIAELERLHIVYFGSSAERTSWKNTEKSILEVLQTIKNKHPDMDFVATLEMILVSLWNGGHNISEEALLFAYDFYMADHAKRLTLLTKRGDQAYKVYKAKILNERLIENILKSVQKDFIFNPSLEVTSRVVMNKVIKKILKENPQITTKVKGLLKSYQELEREYLTLEAGLNFATLSHADYMNAVNQFSKNPYETYAFGLTYRYNMSDYLEIIKKFIKECRRLREEFRASNKDDAQLTPPTDPFATDVLTTLNKMGPILNIDDAMKVFAKVGKFPSNRPEQVYIQTPIDSKGGIDLQTAAMDFNVTGNAGDFQFTISKEKLASLQADMNGIEPLIISVEPLSNVSIFLGLTPQIR